MLHEQFLHYHDADISLTGELVRDRSQSGPRPGILIIHGGAGLDDHARDQARRYAGLGYTVLAADMYGDGVTGDRAKVMAAVTGFRDDPDALVRRGQAALAALSDLPEVGDAVAAVGFCFGGMAALALARAGADIAAAVSIHGSLATPKPVAVGAVTAKVLVCHGAADPHIPMTDVVAFTEQMNTAEADWKLTMYGRAIHGFTHRHAVPGAAPGVAYDAIADERSYADTRAFLAAAFGRR